MEVEELAPMIFRVRSGTIIDTVYNVDLSVPRCTCVHWATSRNKLVKAARENNRDENVRFECKHIAACLEQSKTTVQNRMEQIKRQYQRQSQKTQLLDLMNDLSNDNHE